jgi:hypothetical protein
MPVRDQPPQGPRLLARRMLASGMAFLAGVLRRFAALLAAAPRGSDRLVRRTTVHCPHTGALVEVDLQLDERGKPALVLKCSARRERPPACDEACRRRAEAVIGPARALLILPPGDDEPDEVD